jgi:hypothetical protein
MVQIVELLPARALMRKLWKLNRGFAISMGALYVVLWGLFALLALGGFYVGAKIQKDGSLIVAGLVALGSLGIAEELLRRGRPILYDMLSALLGWAERLDEANRRTRG